MAERFFRVNDNCDLDESFRLHYGGKILTPCEKINDGNITIGLVDNNNINPKRLLLVEADYNQILVTIPKTGEIKKVTKLGKSGIIFFNQDFNSGTLRNTVARILGSGSDRRDHLHVATVQDIENIGWETYWVPLQMSGHMLHARLVSPNSGNGGPILEEEANSLAKLFKKCC